MPLTPHLTRFRHRTVEAYMCACTPTRLAPRVQIEEEQLERAKVSLKTNLMLTLDDTSQARPPIPQHARESPRAARACPVQCLFLPVPRSLRHR